MASLPFGYLLTVLCLCAHTEARSLSHHVSHKRLKHARLQAIRQEILNKLDLEREPDIKNAHVSVEEQRKMVRLYKKRLLESDQKHHILYSDEEFLAKTFYSFSDSGAPPPNTPESAWYREGTQLFYLPVNIPHPKNPLKENVVSSATLKLYTDRVFPEALGQRGQAAIVDNAVWVNIYQLLHPIHKSETTYKRLLDSKWVRLDDPGWVSFDIAGAAQQWLDNPEENFGLEISCDAIPLTDIIHFAANNSDELSLVFLSEELAPNVNILIQERSILGRQKRAASLDRRDCVREDGENRCCRYPLYVNFTEIGEDWIVSPEGFQAYYCDGSCPHLYRAAHEFTKIQSLIHSLNPSAAPAPCCTATELSSLTILHYDSDGQLRVTDLSDMVVQNCGCA